MAQRLKITAILILYYPLLYYPLLYYTILYYTILYYTILSCTTLYCTTLHYTVLHYTTLHYTTLHSTTRHSTTLYYATLYYMTLHYTILCQTNTCSLALNGRAKVQKTSWKRDPAEGTVRCDVTSDPGLRFTSQRHMISELLLDPLGLVVLLAALGMAQSPLCNAVKSTSEDTRSKTETGPSPLVTNTPSLSAHCAWPGDVMLGDAVVVGAWLHARLCPLVSAGDKQTAHVSVSAMALPKDSPGATGQQGTDPRLKSEKKAGSRPFAKVSAGTERTPGWLECRMC